MSREWKPGWVTNMHHQLVRIEEGQVWGYLIPGVLVALTSDMVEGLLPLVVVSTSPSGEVVLRCTKPELVEQTFPLKETTFKGKTQMSRDCPFMVVDDRMAKGSKGELQAGDLLANEAWDVWQDMHNRTLFEGPPIVEEKV